MSVILTGEATFAAGTPTVVEGASHETSFALVFEDDGDMGYLYGLDTALEAQPILEVLLIYSVAELEDGDEPILVQLVWSHDGLKAAMLIDGEPHAIFDFSATRAWCLTGESASLDRWSEHSYEWDDEAMLLFQE